MRQHIKFLSVCLVFVLNPGATDGADVITVTEDSDVVLPCSLSSKENLESKLFDWKKDQNMEVFLYDGGLTYGNGFTGQDKDFEGRVSYFPDELKKGNASIKITKTKVSDSGTYTCIFPRLQPSQTFSVQLVVGKLVVCPLGRDEADGSLVAEYLFVGCLVAGCLFAGAVIVAASQLLTVKKCSALCHKVIHILSGLKPQPDSKQQNGKCNINVYTMKNAPADQPDSSEISLQLI